MSIGKPEPELDLSHQVAAMITRVARLERETDRIRRIMADYHPRHCTDPAAVHPGLVPTDPTDETFLAAAQARVEENI